MGLSLLGVVPEDRVLKDTWMSGVWPGSAVGRTLKAFRQSLRARSQRQEKGLNQAQGQA